jgi:hypothetical protein
LNAAYMPLYLEGRKKRVTTDERLRPGERKSAFCRRMATLLAKHQGEWDGWTRTVELVRKERAMRLGQRVSEAGAKAQARRLSR